MLAAVNSTLTLPTCLIKEAFLEPKVERVKRASPLANCNGCMITQ
jgi:hypothetical protein